MSFPSTPRYIVPALLRGVARAAVATCLVAAFFVAVQDILIFPGLIRALAAPGSPPDGVDALYTTASDGKRVSIWREGAGPGERRGVALLFPGNAETLATFHQVQRWLKPMGIASYAVEYRGHSRGSGWPSERGLYLDADAALELVAREEGIEPREILLFGVSIGSGPASYLAERHDARTLILVAPFTSLGDLVREMPFVGYLEPFLRYRFPVLERVRSLTGTCVVIAHGKRDDVVPYRHSEILREAGGGRLTLVTSERSGHNDILMHASREVAEAIAGCHDWESAGGVTVEQAP